MFTIYNGYNKYSNSIVSVLLTIDTMIDAKTGYTCTIRGMIHWCSSSDCLSPIITVLVRENGFSYT